MISLSQPPYTQAVMIQNYHYIGLQYDKGIFRGC